MRDISLDDAEPLYEALLKTKGTLKFKRGTNNCYEYIVIPKWATRMIAEDIRMYIQGW